MVRILNTIILSCVIFNLIGQALVEIDAHS